jgi:glyoxylase-like metal-dependent hydrolase (beta-lactamase superfamily II)
VRLGELEVTVVKDGGFRLDGGAMFGVVPKPLWEKRMPADERNRIFMDMNCLLIRAGGKLALIETGAGDKMSAKLKDIYDIGKGKRLLENLADRGVKPEQIDIVINTHLHFDHCGWNTRMVEGKAVATFPNATYYVQRGELEHAKNPTERDSASYFPENFLPIEAARKWKLLEGDAEILPGVEVIRVPGHNADMQCVRLTGGGKWAFFFVDLVPTTAHLPYAWLMGYDLYPLKTLANKKKWIPEVAEGDGIALFAHDPEIPVAKLRLSEKGHDTYIAEPIAAD